MSPTPTPAPDTRSIEELIDAARAQASEDAAHDGSPEFGAQLWDSSARATEDMLGLADHSATLDEPGRYGALRVASERASATVERGVAAVRASVAEVLGSARRLLTLRRVVGHNWHRRIEAEHPGVLAALIVVAIGAEAVFASTAAKAVGLYDLWKQLLFGAGAAIAYLGVGAFIGRALVPDVEVRPSDDGDSDAPHADPVIRGRRHRTPIGTQVLVGALALWIVGTTGLTILRESYATQEAAAQRAEQAQSRQTLAGSSGGSDSKVVIAKDTHNPLVDGVAMWCIAAMIGAGLTFLEATRSDPVVREWRETVRSLGGATARLEARAAALGAADVERRDALEALRSHHDGLAHRTSAHGHLASAQALAYLQRAGESVTPDGRLGPVQAAEAAGHRDEIDHHLTNAASTDRAVAEVEHHLAVVLALAATAQGVEPDDAQVDLELCDQVRTWLVTHVAPDETARPARGGAAPASAAQDASDQRDAHRVNGSGRDADPAPVT